MSGKGVFLEQCSAGDKRKEGGGNNPYHHGDGVMAAMSSMKATQPSERRGPPALVWSLSSSSGLLGTITLNMNLPGVPGSRQEGWPYTGSMPARDSMSSSFSVFGELVDSKLVPQSSSRTSYYFWNLKPKANGAVSFAARQRQHG